MSGSQRVPVNSPLALTPPVSQQRVLEQLAQCDEADLLGHLQPLKVQSWERCVASSWHPVLMRFDAILGAFLKSGMGFNGHPSEELVCEVLRVLHDVLLLHQELKGPVEKLRDLLQCSELKVLLGVLRCLAACPPSRHLQAGHAASLERRLEVLACGGGYLETGSFRDACTSEDYVLEDFRADGAGEGDAQPSEFKAGADSGDFEELRRQLEAQRGEPSAAFPEQLLQLRLWCRARSLEGRREVVAIALLAICNVVKHIRAFVLQQYLQKRPGLLSELCEMLQSLQSVGTDAGIAALRVTAAFLDARFGQSRSEASQLSQMLGLALPHGIVACALRGLLGHRPADDQLEAHNAVLSAALDLFQITTVNNHQSSAQLGHAGMILAMLELMQRTDVPSLAAVASMLRCLELAAEVSSTAALVLFRDFNGLQAFSLRLQREVELLMVLEFTGDALEMEPPPTAAPPEERQRFRALLEEVTARRRLCRQLLKNIQTALQCSEVLQAGLANIFQGPMMDALKVAVKAPVRVGLSLFGTAIDIVSSVIQDDPSRVPQLIETNVLPAVLGVLSKETMRSTECLSFVPGILASVALHAVGEDFILGLASKPVQLVIDVLVDPSFVPLLYSQPELIQIMSTQMDKVLRNRPTGMCKLTEHVVESMLSSLRAILEQAKAYPDWTPWDLEDHTGYLPDRLAPFSRFCWSLLSTNEHVLKCFIEKQGLSLVRDIQELPCLPYFFTSLEGQQHPVASLFNLQAKCEDGGAAVGAELKEMLSTNLEKVLPILKECAAGDPHVVMSSMETSHVLAFLQALSRVCSVLEDLLSIAREGSSLQVMEAVRQFLVDLAPLAALIFVVAAWQPHDRERMPPTACYHESTKQVFTPSSKEDAASSAGSVQQGGGGGEKAGDKGGESPILRAARVGFRLTCRTLRQLMQLSSKLQTRVRREASAVVPFTMARCLAQVAKAVLVAPRPPSSPVALRWVAEVFDLLQKMHEEQNKVALRSLALCAFYQAGCFELLQPLIQMSLEKIGDGKEDLAAGTALSAALGYFEKVTSTRRFANAYLRDEAMMSKEMLCKSIQAEALRCLLPVWRHPQFASFPRSSCCSLLKVWLHLLQEPKSEPRTPDWHRLSGIPALPNIAGMQHVQHVQQEMVRTADGNRVPDAAASLMANDPAIIAVSGTSVPTSGTTGTANTPSARTPSGATSDSVTNIQGTLVDMGFSRTQVDAAQRHFGSRGTEDISEMIVWMVANPTVDGEVSETLRQPVVQEEFQTLLAGLLDDLLPRLLACGHQVQKALNAVVDTICYVAENPSPFWERPGDSDSNGKAVIRACVAELGDADGQPSSETLICVTQILANLLHRRPATSKTLGEQGIAELLVKLHRWCTQGIDFSIPAAERGHRTLHFGTSAPAPSGVGEPLLAPPPWLTPTIVCVQQLLCQADLVKMRESREALDKETQQMWVSLILDLMYAFPGLDGTLAQPCLQVLLRLCSVSVGAKAFLAYQQNPRFQKDAQAEGGDGGVKALRLLFRLSRQAAFQGLLQMLSDLVVILLEEAPVLGQRMELEILGILGARKEVPARDIYQPLFPLMSRNPQLFEDSLKAVARRTRAASPDALLLAPIPEAERPRGPKKSLLPASALLVLQTLVNEICFGVDVQFRTTFPKLHEVASKTLEQAEEGASNPSSGSLPPAYPLALGPNCILCVLDGLLLRMPGVAMLFLKSPLPFPAASVQADGGYFVVDATSAPSHKSLLLLMMRHLLPQLARLSELWPKQISLLKYSQRSAMSGAVNPVQRLLPHLGSVLCAAARQPGEPRKTLVSEAILLLRSLAEGPRATEDQGIYGSQVSTLSTIVARLLSAANAAERKEEKESPGNSAAQDKASPRLAALDNPGGSNAAAPPAKKARTRHPVPFSAKEELQVLRDAFVAVLARLDLQRSESSQVAGAVVRCLELLSRREIQTGSDPRRTDASPGGPEMLRSESLDSERAARVFHVIGMEAHVDEALRREELRPGDEEAVEIAAVEDDEEEEDDDEEMGEGGDEALEEDEDEDEEGGEMDQMDADGEEAEHHGHDGEDEGDEDEDEGYDENEEEYDGDMDGDFADGQGIASVLQNAIQVFDQENPGMDGESMTFRVDIDLGEAGVIHGVHRGGQFRRMQMPPPPGLRVAAAAGSVGWAEPGEMDAPQEHPLLRRDQSHMESHQSQIAQWMPPGNIRQFLGNVEPIIRTPSNLSAPSGGNNAGSRGEDFEAVFSEVARRLQSNFVAPPEVPSNATSGSVEEAKLPAEPAADGLLTEQLPPQDEEMRPVAEHPPQVSHEGNIPVPALVPGAVIYSTAGGPQADQAVQTGPSSADIWALAQAFATVQGIPAPGAPGLQTLPLPLHEAPPPPEPPGGTSGAAPAEPQAEPPAEPQEAAGPPAEPPAAPAEPADHAAEPVEQAAEEEDAAACLGISELQRLASRLGCSQSAILQAAGIDISVVAALPEDMRASVVMAEVSQVSLDHLRRAPQASDPAAATANEAGSAASEIDAVVLEALPAEIRDEVLREEAVRRREQQASAAAPPRSTQSSEMDNASFIASLDPLLREEVLLSAPEEVLRTLPAELVAEAQLLRDRAFTRIALRREVPAVSGRPVVGIAPPGLSQAPGPSQRVAQAQAAQAQPQAWPRQHAHLLMIEQQLLHHSSGVRRWGGPIGLQRPPRGQGEAGTPGLSSFDDADQHLLQRLGDFDDGTALEVPLPASVVPHTCRLLYLRVEIATMPMTRLCFNLSLHPVTRGWLLGHFLILLCRQTEPEASLESLPPPCLFEGLDGPQSQSKQPHRSPLEVQSVGSQRVLAILAYLLRRVPQCGDFFARKLQSEPWLKAFHAPQWSSDRSKKSRGDVSLLQGIAISDLPGHCAVNLLMQLVNTRLYLSSSRHAAWLLSVLHALLVPQPALSSSKDSEGSFSEGLPQTAPAQAAPAPASAAGEATAATVPASAAAAEETQETPGSQRWSKIIEDMHTALSQKSVLALCHFLCHAGSGHGSSSEGDAFQLAGDILVALAASRTHLDTVRCELMQVLATLVTDIERALQECEAAAAEPSTIESRFLRVVRTLTEVFREASKSGPDRSSKPEGFMEEARVENLWDALDRTLERLDDPEMSATPAQKLLSSGEGGDAGSPDNSQSPPKPLLNRLLPLIEAFFVLHGHITEEADKAPRPEEPLQMTEGGSSSSHPGKVPSRHVFAEFHEQSAAERSRFGQFCKKHRRPLNALLKQTPSLLSKSFAPVLQYMPTCLDFDNKRAYFRAQLRSRRLESRYQTIRLRVRRNEIFMDSYHQLRIRTGEEMRAKIQVQFQGEEGIDAGGVAKEWYGALAREIFNPNYALFVQAGGKACTYHPNPMSYVNRDHLQFFHFIGRVVGKAIHDGQNLEAWFTRGFYKHMLGKKVIPADLEAFDPEYFSNLKWMLDHDITDIIELTFSAESDELGQIKVVDLKPQGRTLPVTNENKHEYIQLMSEHKMTNSVKQQIEHFLKGLHEIVPPQLLSLFDDKELELLISGLPDIDIEDLKQNTEYHNYTPLSDQVQWFWKVLSEFTQEQRAWFLQFATGTSRVPVEGFKGLVGMRGPQKFSLHRAYGSDRLPSAHTCFNQVDLPEYPSEDVLRDKLLQAVSEGHEGFGFA